MPRGNRMGQGQASSTLLTFREARRLVRKLGLKRPYQYRAILPSNPDLPEHPDRYYRNHGWVNWSEFFGISRGFKYPTLEKAKKAALNLSIRDSKDYQRKYRLDFRLPCLPKDLYPDWTDWRDFLGKEKKQPYASLAQAMQAVHRLGIRTSKEYHARYKKDKGLPSFPSKTFAGEWKGWRHFLGKPEIHYLSFIQARSLARKEGLRSGLEYHRFQKMHPELPARPELVYRHKGWRGWISFLGSARTIYPTAKTAGAAARRMGITSRSEYKRRYQENPKLPAAPDVRYRDWSGWADFLGKNTPGWHNPNWMNYREARTYARNREIQNHQEYIDARKREPRLPSHPESMYKEWTSWMDFLGNRKTRPYRTYFEGKPSVNPIFT